MREYEPANYRFHKEHQWYSGTITAIEDDEFSHGPVVKFIIDLDDDDDREVHAIATDRLTPKSKLTGWTKGLFGENAVGEGKQVDLDDAIDMRVEVMFTYGQNTAGEPNESVSLMRRLEDKLEVESRELSEEEQLAAPW